MSKKNFGKLKEFIELAKSEGCSELKYEADGEKFAIQLGGGAPVMTTQMAQPAAPMASVAQSAAVSNFLEIKSPFVGTFYTSPSPDAEVFAKVGDKVSPGKVLCIVEAMKIMNEIEADISGEIVEVCVPNESFVEFGQVLYKLKK